MKTLLAIISVFGLLSVAFGQLGWVQNLPVANSMSWRVFLLKGRVPVPLQLLAVPSPRLRLSWGPPPRRRAAQHARQIPRLSCWLRVEPKRQPLLLLPQQREGQRRGHRLAGQLEIEVTCIMLFFSLQYNRDFLLSNFYYVRSSYNG